MATRGRPKGSTNKPKAPTLTANKAAMNSSFGSTASPAPPTVDDGDHEYRGAPLPLGGPPRGAGRPGMAAMLKSKRIKLKTPPMKAKAPGGGGFGPPKGPPPARNPY